MKIQAMGRQKQTKQMASNQVSVYQMLDQNP